MKDLTISLTDQPGSLAALGEATGRANINIEGACAYVEDGARRALKEAGLEVTGEQDVIVVQLEDRPGVLGGVTRRIAAAGVNLKLAYLATGTRLVVAADDLDRAETAI